MTRPILLLEHPSCWLHDPGAAHPESVRRLPALDAALAADPALLVRIERRRATPASEQDLLRVHTAAHVARVREAAAEAADRGTPVWLDEDTAASASSWEAALAAAGCAIDAALAVAAGEVDRAFALARPPGHHATADRAMGFCLLNNVAIAARRGTSSDPPIRPTRARSAAPGPPSSRRRPAGARHAGAVVPSRSRPHRCAPPRSTSGSGSGG